MQEVWQGSEPPPLAPSPILWPPLLRKETTCLFWQTKAPARPTTCYFSIITKKGKFGETNQWNKDHTFFLMRNRTVDKPAIVSVFVSYSATWSKSVLVITLKVQCRLLFCSQIRSRIVFMRSGEKLLGEGCKKWDSSPLPAGRWRKRKPLFPLFWQTSTTVADQALFFSEHPHEDPPSNSLGTSKQWI